MAKDIDKLIEALSGKKVPLATLDSKWHRLFTKVEKTKEIKECENNLNELLRYQGKINNQIKNLKQMKKRLMDEIVKLMEDNDGQAKVDNNKNLIDNCNINIDKIQDENLELPDKLAQANKNLMNATMEVCYDALHENEKEIDELDEWLTNLRIELKKKVVKKQDLEMKNAEIYTYMHDIFGAEVVDLFDMKYDPTERIIKTEEQFKKNKD